MQVRIFGKLSASLLALTLLCSAQASADEPRMARANMVAAKLEVLNSVGRDCQFQLDASTTKGMVSAECTRYLNNMNGSYFDSVQEECLDMFEWVKETVLAARSKGLEPTGADKKEIEAIRASCDLDRHVYVLKPLNTMQALRELE